MAIALFLTTLGLILCGFPVAFILAGVSLLFIFIGIATGTLDFHFLDIIASRIYGIMTNGTLIAIPPFIFMGVILQRSQIAEELLERMSSSLSWLRGDLGIAVVIVGALLATSTGIVGATVVTMGLISLPAMLKRNYDPRIACGTICACGTLGQIIPPSIVLILLGDVISSSFQIAQLNMGIFSPQSVSIIDLFAGALIPGFVLAGLYLLYLIIVAYTKPQMMPSPIKSDTKISWMKTIKVLIAPLLLIVLVLGTILAGITTPTEAASIGAIGALILSLLKRTMSLKKLGEISRISTRTTCMVFMILIGASLFSLGFRGFGGDDLVHELIMQLPGGVPGKIFFVMLVMFILGFFLDFIEITLVIVPIIAPILFMLGVDPIWLGILIAVNLQTSFLTPPFGFSLFYFRGVAPTAIIKTEQIYAGVMPFIAIQLLMLALLVIWPQLATWLPNKLFPQ